MAQQSKDKERRAAEDEEDDETSEESSAGVRDDAPLARTTDELPEAASEDEEPAAPATAAQLGVDRYVMAGFFAGGMISAYVLGRAIQGLWGAASNKDWFSRALPRLAAVADDDKALYSTILGGLIALLVVVRTYRKPSVRTWTDEVASELTKVVWPSRKEVVNSTMIVVVASAFATVYLALLDRLWAFVTNIVYGDGS